MMKQILQKILENESVLIISHINPDGDAVGSSLALSLALEACGKTVVMYNESPIPAVYRFLPAVDRIQKSLASLPLHPIAVVLDCADLKRIGEMSQFPDRLPSMLINIDHHVTNTGFGHLRMVDVSACSTAEIVYRMIRLLGVPIDREMATCIYTGILTDTGSFRFANTTRTAFSICNDMICHGADPYEVATHVYGRYSLGRLKLLNLALDSIEISENGKLSFMMLTQEMLDESGTQPEDADGMINYAKQIQDVKVAVLILEHGNGCTGNEGLTRYQVSLRSDGTVDVSELAAAFGGGGHPRAAGFSIEGRLSELKGGILEWFERQDPYFYES